MRDPIQGEVVGILRGGESRSLIDAYFLAWPGAFASSIRQGKYAIRLSRRLAKMENVFREARSCWACDVYTEHAANQCPLTIANGPSMILRHPAFLATTGACAVAGR